MLNSLKGLVLLALSVSASTLYADYPWQSPQQIARGVTVSQCVTESPRKMRIIAVKVESVEKDGRGLAISVGEVSFEQLSTQ